MSGITGVFHVDGGPAEPAALDRMMDRLRHRGPAGGWSTPEGQVGLGHLTHDAGDGVRRPVTDPGGRLALVADARLDNRDELCRALGRDAVGVTDAELILGAYERWGDACPEHLLGDFAFAVWDGARRRLFCARDHLGARSFYYHASATRFVFASEIKGVLAHGGVPCDLDEERIADYLGQVFVDKTRTFYAAVRRLAPGHSLCVSAAGVTLRKYWELDPGLRIERAGDEEYADGFRSIFTAALGARMRTDGPLGVLLSGGLDSSAIVCLARAQRHEWGHTPLPTLSATFPAFPDIDEREYIDAVLEGGLIEPSFVSASDTSPLEEIDATLRSEDEPFFSPNLYVYWALARNARDRGLRVLIDGVDGDTTVSHGMELLAELCRRGRWLRAAREARSLGRRFGHPGRRFLWHFGVVPGLVRPAAHFALRTFGRGTPPPPATVAPEFAARVRWHERLSDLLGPLARPPRSLRESHWRALTSALVPHYLETNDKVAAAFGLDHRHPYFDRRLVEFCYGIPARQKLRDGWDRVVQRQAMSGVLPPRIQWRLQKSHWGAQFKHGFLERDRERLGALVAAMGSGGIARFVDVNAVTATFGRACGPEIGGTDGMNLWLAVTLQVWLEQVAGAKS